MLTLNPINDRGKFLVIYGANNVGKTTQIRLLAKKFVDAGYQILLVKYPLYQLAPTGPQINKILRDPKEAHKLTEIEFQTLYAQNRKDFQRTLVEVLNAGIMVLAEDYTGTGLAWGMTRGTEIKQLEKINKKLILPDLAILLDGIRFKDGIELNHRNESDGEHVWQKNREAHLFLAQRYGWQSVKAHRSKEEINEDIWQIFQNTFIKA